MDAEIVNTAEVIRWLRNARNANSDVHQMCNQYMVGDEDDAILELTNLIFNTMISVEQQLTARDTLLKTLASNANDICSDLEWYQYATHNYDGMSDEDREVYNSIDKNEEERRRLVDAVSKVVGDGQ